MIRKENLKISFGEASLRGSLIIAQQSATTYAQALAQVLRLKEISKVTSSSKKSRKQP